MTTGVNLLMTGLNMTKIEVTTTAGPLANTTVATETTGQLFTNVLSVSDLIAQ